MSYQQIADYTDIGMLFSLKKRSYLFTYFFLKSLSSWSEPSNRWLVAKCESSWNTQRFVYITICGLIATSIIFEVFIHRARILATMTSSSTTKSLRIHNYVLKLMPSRLMRRLRIMPIRRKRCSKIVSSRYIWDIVHPIFPVFSDICVY